MSTTTIAHVHEIQIAFVRDNHGYPYAAVCSCGWESATYCARHAAITMSEFHIAEVTA